jgi:AcrR family transcriptional regulator
LADDGHPAPGLIIQAFSMAEASRRLGVAVAAPYPHFADREDLLAAVAIRAAELLGRQLDREAVAADPAGRLAAAAGCYVRFRHRPAGRHRRGRSGRGRGARPHRRPLPAHRPTARIVIMTSVRIL